MHRLLTTLLTASLVLAGPLASASACINDRDTFKAEREFKSTYEKAAPSGSPSPESPAEPRERLLTWGGGGAGVLLLLGALVLTVRRSRLD